MTVEREDLPDDIEQLKQLVLAHRAELEHLNLIIAKLKRMQFGRRSEKLAQEIDQLELRLEELQSAQAQAAAPAQGKVAEKIQPVRRPLPDHLPRERIVHEPACNCPDCGAAMRKIGEDLSEVLDYTSELPGNPACAPETGLSAV